MDNDAAYQFEILPGVSRTFALTIPQLPTRLRTVVANAYLLCRIADTIEDDAGLSPEQREQFHQQFVELIDSDNSPEVFAKELFPLLSESTLQAEKDLVKNTARVIRYTNSLNQVQRSALQRCVAAMSKGMPLFEKNASLAGLPDLAAHNRYCYFVAGVVGEMLTELFCDYSTEINKHHERMMTLAPSFGQALQMTNILKDVWDDRERGVSWLPRDVFQRYDFDLSQLTPERYAEGFGQGMRELVGVAHGHCCNALEYILHIPRNEAGIRRFCLWALGLAILTLRKVYHNPRFINGAEVKVTRKTVKATIFSTQMTCRSDAMLRLLFKMAGMGLPCEQVTWDTREVVKF